MRKLKMITRRDAIEFNLEKPTPFVFVDLKYTGKTDTLILKSQAANQDGATVWNVQYESREMELSGFVYGETRQELDANWQRLHSLMSSKEQIRFEYTNHIGSYWINGLISGIPDEGARVQKVGHYKPVTCTIYCADPLWKIIGPKQSAYFSRYGMFKFPFSIPPPGIQFGASGYRVAIVNIGDAVAPIEIRIMGPAINPRIENVTTGEHMEFYYTLSADEELYINTTPTQEAITLINHSTGNSRNAFDLLLNVDEQGWEFITIAPGENRIRYIYPKNTVIPPVVMLQWQILLGGVL